MCFLFCKHRFHSISLCPCSALWILHQLCDTEGLGLPCVGRVARCPLSVHWGHFHCVRFLNWLLRKSAPALSDGLWQQFLIIIYAFRIFFQLLKLPIQFFFSICTIYAYSLLFCHSFPPILPPAISFFNVP